MLEIVSSQFDAAAIGEGADPLEMDRSLRAELTVKGMTFNKPDPVQFRAALVKAGFYTQCQKTYGKPTALRPGRGWSSTPGR